MSKILEITDEVGEAQASPKRDLPLDWKWFALVCVLLGLSGGLRYWRDSQFSSLSKESEASPFALRKIPRELGDWHMIEGSENTLEPEIARVAGAADHVIRQYVDEKSGETAAVMILYGLAYTVWAHTPAACYPANGFRFVLPSQDEDVDVRVPEKPNPVRFRSQHFVRT